MIEKSKLYENLNKIDNEWRDYIDDTIFEDEALDAIRKFSSENIKSQRKAVLGIDIYRYSGYSEDRQNLIPFIFDILRDENAKVLPMMEPSLFPKDFKFEFISAGDGGFFIFDTPLHAFVYNTSFHAALRIFNTGHKYPRLSQFIGEIVIRSAITYDNIFYYENNVYGKGIITNARILSKDRLNRFLIDSNVYNYFTRFFNGIETLPVIPNETVKRVLKIEGDFKSYYFPNSDDPADDRQITYYPIRNINIQKVEDLFEKEAQLTLYNIEVQIEMHLNELFSRSEHNNFIFTVGNANSMR
jgi:hypothetical protein